MNPAYWDALKMAPSMAKSHSANEAETVKIEPQPVSAASLTLVQKSPFAVADPRAALIQELRGDADVLDQQSAEMNEQAQQIIRRAAEITARALALRVSADHLDAHPPE